MSESEHETSVAVENKTDNAITLNNKLPKHLRQRYWTSWEELRLIELWRLHQHEIETYEANGPVFRVIAAGMKEFGFFLNGQECRRRINSFRNKYASEKERLKYTNKTSDWRLYSLMRCVLHPQETKLIDLKHENKIVNELLNKIPNLSLELQMALQKENENLTTPNVATGQQTSINNNCTDNDATDVKRRYKPRGPRNINGVINICRNGVTSQFLKRQLTTSYLAQIRADNIRLKEQRDAAMKLLLAEQREYELLEQMLQRWTKQNEHLMSAVK